MLLLCQLLIASSGASAQSNGWATERVENRTGAVSSVSHPAKKRIAALRHSDTLEGSRFTVTSDSPLNDYSSYVEGERFFVLLPQATLMNPQKNGGGRGFVDLRIEERDEDVLLSFILQPGATVNFSQVFNRLDVNFVTNEQANKEERSFE